MSARTKGTTPADRHELLALLFSTDELRLLGRAARQDRLEPEEWARAILLHAARFRTACTARKVARVAPGAPSPAVRAAPIAPVISAAPNRTADKANALPTPPGPIRGGAPPVGKVAVSFQKAARATPPRPISPAREAEQKATEAATRRSPISATARGILAIRSRELSTAERRTLEQELGPGGFRAWMDTRAPKTPLEWGELADEEMRIRREAEIVRAEREQQPPAGHLAGEGRARYRGIA